MPPCSYPRGLPNMTALELLQRRDWYGIALIIVAYFGRLIVSQFKLGTERWFRSSRARERLTPLPVPSFFFLFFFSPLPRVQTPGRGDWCA